MVNQIFDYELALAEHILDSIQNTDFEDAPLMDLTVIADVSNQVNTTFVPPDVRRLQQSTFKIFLVIRILFKSVETRDNDDIELLIGDSLNNENERQLFIDRLVQRNPSFFSGTTVGMVEVEGVQPQEEQLVSDLPPSTNSNFLYIVLGASGGGFAALVALGLLSFRRRSSFISVGSPEDMEGGGSQQTPDRRLDVGSEVLVERQDDISTLGDPVFGVGGGLIGSNAERDEQTASVGNDYDYTKQYLKAQGLSSLGDSGDVSRQYRESGTSPTPSSHSGSHGKFVGPVGAYVFSDDVSNDDQEYVPESMEEQFELEVPPGKLGMVIDTPNGSSPIVHAVKPESVLANKVLVGDRLLAVDGDDVTAMTAVQVSKLISLKSDQTRALTFARFGASELLNEQIDDIDEEAY